MTSAADGDLLIRVDARDEPLGPATRAECHAGEGLLHRAFSIYLFDRGGRLLLQRRSAAKDLWPLTWANSCCSHPRWGEEIAAAAERRLAEELGLRAALRPLFRFEYQARFDADGSEYELCTVFAGRGAEVVAADPAEVAEWRWVGADDLDRALAADPQAYAPWLHLGWQRLRRDHWPEIAALVRA